MGGRGVRQPRAGRRRLRLRHRRRVPRRRHRAPDVHVRGGRNAGARGGDVRARRRVAAGGEASERAGPARGHRARGLPRHRRVPRRLRGLLPRLARPVLPRRRARSASPTASRSSCRFAAAEAVAPAHRPRALSFGVAGGTLAAFIGPEVAKATRTALAEEFAACFLAMAGCYAALVAFTLRIRSAGPRPRYDISNPDDAPIRTDARESLAWPSAELERSVNARKGLAGVTCAWTAMFLVMSAAPLAMTGRREGGHSFDEAATALQLHMIAMFFPGLLGTGDLVTKVRAGRGVQRRVRVVPGVRRVYVRRRSGAHRLRRTRSAVDVSRPPRHPRRRVEPDVHRRVRAHAARRGNIGRGRVGSGAGRRGGGDVFRRGDRAAFAGAALGAVGWRGLCACVAPFAVGMAWYGCRPGGAGAGADRPGRVSAGRGCGDGNGNREASSSSSGGAARV